ncbi:MAG: UDP-N-acetylmuramate dehydrogenase [Chloroflexota bacterium]|nr:UDP-N-acetylmuramate dehydrogenase [Dehalococcoidia bacterium]MDW8253171.1 UDP-N-acetylmuramate dehydrogenase [Chloroflexota bacterium]
MNERRTAFAARLRGVVPVRFDEPLAKHTTFRIGGPADAYVQARTLPQLIAAVRAAWEEDLPVLVIGGGSNLLVLDGGVRGVVIESRARQVMGEPSGSRPPRQRSLEEALALANEQPAAETLELTVEAGMPLAALARRTALAGWAGLEWAVDIPGTVGGAVVNNAGAHGGEMASSMTAALLLHPASDVPVWRPAAELGLTYRASLLKEAAPSCPRPVVLAAKFALRRGDPLTLRAAVAQYSQYRRRTQPVGAGAGSIFKNPPEAAAGWLIERANLKGAQVGAVRVSDLHGNFMLNLGGATAADVLALVDLVRERVFAQWGVFLELEIQIVGEAER